MKNTKLTLPKSLNLKLSKTVWFCLGGGVLLLALAFLGVARFQQITEQKQLADELTQVKSQLERLELGQLETQKEQLQQKVNAANAALQDNTETLVQYVTSITGDETLFSLAKSCNVIISDITSSDINMSKLGDIPCSVFPIEVKIDGALADVVNFTTQLKNDFGNSMVESVDISTISPDNSGETTETGTIPTASSDIFEADVQLMVYIYKGS